MVKFKKETRKKKKMIEKSGERWEMLQHNINFSNFFIIVVKEKKTIILQPHKKAIINIEGK
jgi:hypothetical protein